MQEKFILSALTLCLLAACGGSDGNTNSDGISPAPPSYAAPLPPGSTRRPQSDAQEDDAQLPGQQPGNQQPGNNNQQPGNRPPGNNNAQSSQPQPVTTLDTGIDDHFWREGRTDFQTFTLKVGGGELEKAERGKARHFDLNALSQGFTGPTPAQLEYVGDSASFGTEVSLRSYRGFYAGAFYHDKEERTNALQHDWQAYASPTKAIELPRRGKATYQGKAFNMDEENDGVLTYNMDFAQKRGSGTVSATTRHAELALREAEIQTLTGDFGKYYGVENGNIGTGNGVTSGRYNLMIAGPNAEEIAGTLTYWPSVNPRNTTNQVFYGKRDEIAP